MPQYRPNQTRKTGHPAQTNASAGTRPRAQAAGTARAAKRRPQRFALLCAAVLALLLLVILVLRLALPTKRPGPPWVIALDAGHGAGDVGADGIITEIEMTEPTVDALYALLDADENFEPVRTRQNNQNPSLAARTRTARRAGAHLLLSVHGNGDTSPDTTGFECYPAPPGRTWHEDSLRFAQLVAGQMGEAGANLRGEGGVRYAYYDDEGNKFFREESDTATYEEGSFAVVETPDCPAVLAEQCFVTSPTDVAAFASPEGGRVVAQQYYRAICQYFGVPPTALQGQSAAG